MMILAVKTIQRNMRICKWYHVLFVGRSRYPIPSTERINKSFKARLHMYVLQFVSLLLLPYFQMTMDIILQIEPRAIIMLKITTYIDIVKIKHSKITNKLHPLYVNIIWLLNNKNSVRARAVCMTILLYYLSL